MPLADLIKVNASNPDQPCNNFGINKYLGQNFVNLYNAGEVIFFASESDLSFLELMWLKNVLTAFVNEHVDIGHLQKPVDATNFLTETKTQLFSVSLFNLDQQ